MQPQVKTDYYTVAEYFALEETVANKNEYFNGSIFPMTGATVNHNRLTGSLYAALLFALKGQDSEVFISDMRLWIATADLYTYPDIMIVKGQPEYVAGRRDTISNPSVVVEVLSKSTQAYDRGDKFSFYRQLPSLREYVLIDQYKYCVEQFAKTEAGNWLFTDYGSKEVLSLKAVTFQMSLAELYSKVVFDADVIGDPSLPLN
jgi:Uma2 family endonuclease